jgi:hypothetical protein
MSTTSNARVDGRKRLGANERRFLVAVALLHRESHQPPAWRAAWKRAGLGANAYWVTEKASAHGYVVFTPGVPHTLRLTPAGVQAAETGVHRFAPQRKHPQTPSSALEHRAGNATEAGQVRFTSNGSEELGGLVMNARDRSFAALIRAAGFTMLAAPSGKSARVRVKGQKKAIAVCYFHEPHIALVLKVDGRSTKVTTENLDAGVEMLRAAKEAQS